MEDLDDLPLKQVVSIESLFATFGEASTVAKEISVLSGEETVVKELKDGWRVELTVAALRLWLRELEARRQDGESRGRHSDIDFEETATGLLPNPDDDDSWPESTNQ